jgi:hypothetical protein
MASEAVGAGSIPAGITTLKLHIKALKSRVYANFWVGGGGGRMALKRTK